MNYFGICKDVLTIVLKEKKDYFALINQRCNKEKLTDKDKYICLNLVGSFLRNYYFIRKATEFVFGKNDFDVLLITGLYFVNNAFVKSCSEEDALNYLKEELLKKDINVSNDQITVLNGICKDKKAYAFPSTNIRKGSMAYFSMKFNLPEWFVKMMIKYYGSENGLASCRLISRVPTQNLWLNSLKDITESDKQLLNDFELCDNGTYEYKGKGSFRKTQAIKEKVLLPIQLSYLDLLNELPDLKHSNYTIYLGGRSFIYMPIVARYNKEGNQATIIASALKDNYELLNIKKTYGLKNLYFNEAQPDSLDSLISKKQDLFVMFAKSSEFDKLRNSPDYSVIFDSNKLDEYIASENLSLESGAKYVSDGGYLVYCVGTLGLKETTKLVANFLENNAEFELIKEKQYLPNENNSIFYYAILRKKDNA